MHDELKRQTNTNIEDLYQNRCRIRYTTHMANGTYPVQRVGSQIQSCCVVSTPPTRSDLRRSQNPQKSQKVHPADQAKAEVHWSLETQSMFTPSLSKKNCGPINAGPCAGPAPARDYWQLTTQLSDYSLIPISTNEI